MNNKDLVQLRQKPLKNGGYSLYLDYYANGVRQYRFLRLYLQPGTDRATKDLNRQTMAAALAIKAQAITDIINGRAGFATGGDRLFTEFVESEAAGEKASTRHIDDVFLLQWRAFRGDGVTLREITPQLLIQFLKYLASIGIKSSTQHNYYSRACKYIHRAVSAELINSDPTAAVPRDLKPSRVQNSREFLTINEINALIETDCLSEATKQAFLFSCFTGLRWSDIRSLTWEEIKNGYVVKTQQKTGGVVRIPISPNAARFLPEEGEGRVFRLDGFLSAHNYRLKKWCRQAGIKKTISFHCARHTFATLLLTYGADIYTVSKLLGHTNVQTTQIYAKIVDAKRDEAVNKIPTL